MMATLENLESILLMGPGPSCVHEAVYAALARPTIGHLDPVFIAVMDDVKQQLRNLFNTHNALTMPISGTGSAGMETCFVNLVEPGDRVLVLINGVFGMRMQDVATRLGAAATDALERGEHGILMGLIGNEILPTPLEDVVSKAKPLDLSLLKLASVLAK